MDPTLLLILAILGFWVCAGIGAALMLGWLIRRARRRHEAEVFAVLCEAVERHPAGGTLFAFRARPCGHKLYTPSLDVIDMEHLELTHVTTCPVAQELLPRKDAA